ncbi:NAD(P)/FAD-dependent oxidoreductase [Enterovirga rhinocerotis]|uniref:Glycine/D-amino acid oxidase-like deaminating enzyme n=1 Tax=Enterovirga rhinocerotis TaxID=1339210 RepID=A0A4R7C3Q5_9HYPH|nr:FAD-binding oxidoreductase [Enterovirga rhinocerotis]TDR93130.1 glycine/D-amino acid oxidase-like deaminating enzyme [Enterovirga rhinocerotis]
MAANDVYWWEAAPIASPPQKPVDPTCDVVIVGAGYTGLSAAITLARAGRSVQVFDRQRPGEGASTRNGGIASGNLRPSSGELAKTFGEERARAIEAEARTAREDLARFIAEEEIDCDFALVGRFAGASAAGDYEGLAREAERLAKTGIEAHAVPKSEQRGYLGTDYYHGGSVRMDIGGLHPAKFHAGMLRVALAAGVVVHGETGVLSFRQEGDGYRVETSRGVVTARDLIVGTNGYGDRFDRWLRRRMVPVRSRIVATAPLSPNLMATLMPRRMMCAETRRLHYYYRPSPDGTRILFGGRDGTIAGDPSWPAENLRRAMVDVFPELDGTEITHTWFGHVAMNRDMIPRIFSREGMRYAAGYCGSGVVWARWAGRKAALQVLGQEDGRSALDFRPPPAVPLFNGTAWFMPAVFAWMTTMDRIDAWRGRR